jgi:hypothetical protein
VFSMLHPDRAVCCFFAVRVSESVATAAALQISVPTNSYLKRGSRSKITRHRVG